MTKRPPIGILPYHLWAESHPAPSPAQTFHRVMELQFAIERYAQAELRIPDAWIKEFREQHQR